MAWCHGQLKADPDIAGIGVVSSIWIMTGLAISVSWLLWVLAIFDGKTTLNSKFYRALTKFAFSLADIQLVTALAITTSSIILIIKDHETSLYHVYIARCLAHCKFNGYGAALLFDTRSQSNWTWRVFLIACALILDTYWSMLSIKEFKQWGRHTPRCFYNDSRVPLEYITWMYIDIVWQNVGCAWIFLEASGRFEAQLVRLNKYAIDLFKECGGECKKWLAPQSMVSFLYSVITAVWKAVTLFIVSFSVCPPSTTPFTATILFAWNIYEVRRAQQSNKHILVASPAQNLNLSLYGNVNPEEDWGFGQLLPLFLLILPLMQIADIFTEELHVVKSLYYTARDEDDSVLVPNASTAGSTTSQGHTSGASNGLRTRTTGLVTRPPVVAASKTSRQA